VVLADDGQEPGGGWLSWADGLAEAGEGPPDAELTRADDPMLLYFTSGTVAYATVGLCEAAMTCSDRV
jgi:acyl-coenzyme A synthetase/AMP-(fatty) acid ligase